MSKERYNAIIQEAELVTKTEFWKMFWNDIEKLRQYNLQRLRDDITSQEDWVKFAVFQGQLKGIESVMDFPDTIISVLRKKGATAP